MDIPCWFSLIKFNNLFYIYKFHHTISVYRTYYIILLRRFFSYSEWATRRWFFTFFSFRIQMAFAQKANSKSFRTSIFTRFTREVFVSCGFQLYFWPFRNVTRTQQYRTSFREKSVFGRNERRPPYGRGSFITTSLFRGKFLENSVNPKAVTRSQKLDFDGTVCMVGSACALPTFTATLWDVRGYWTIQWTPKICSPLCKLLAYFGRCGRYLLSLSTVCRFSESNYRSWSF